MQNNNFKYPQVNPFVPDGKAHIHADGNGAAYLNQTGTCNCCGGFWCCYGGCVIKGGAAVLSNLGGALIKSKSAEQVAKNSAPKTVVTTTAPAAKTSTSTKTIYIILGIVGGISLIGGVVYMMAHKS